MSSHQQRDYYKHLFTPESKDSDIPLQIHHDTDFQSQHFLNDFIVQGQSILDGNCLFPTLNTLPSEGTDLCISSLTSDNQDNYSVTSSNVDQHEDDLLKDWENSQTFNQDFNINDPSPIANFLDENEVLQLLGQTKSTPVVIPKTPPNNSPMEPDKIGTFNIQNGFDHDTAAEFFVNENLTFLALQEPFSSNYVQNDSWTAFQTTELQSARIQCFFTSHQVVMFDSWKWGGRVMETFESHAHGRVTNIAFNLGNDQKIG